MEDLYYSARQQCIARHFNFRMMLTRNAMLHYPMLAASQLITDIMLICSMNPHQEVAADT